jgi:hypothetical protein
MVAGEIWSFDGRPNGTAAVPNPVTGGTVGVYLKPFLVVLLGAFQGVLLGHVWIAAQWGTTWDDLNRGCSDRVDS